MRSMSVKTVLLPLLRQKALTQGVEQLRVTAVQVGHGEPTKSAFVRRRIVVCIIHHSLFIMKELTFRKKHGTIEKIGVDLYRYIELFIEVSTCEG